MTPAVVALSDAGIEFSLHPDHPSASLGDAAKALGIDQAEMLKTLVAALDRGRLIAAVVPVVARLDLKALATSLR